MDNLVTIQRAKPISKYNYNKDFLNHGLAQIKAEQMFDTLLNLDLIGRWSKSTLESFCTIGWKYEIRR